MQLPDLLVLRPAAWQELLQAGFEAMGPLQAGRVLLAALASAVLASSGASLAEPRAGSEARDPWLAGKLAGVWQLPAVVVLVVGQLPAAWPGLVAAPGSLNLHPGRHWHIRQSSTVRCLCNLHPPVPHSNSLRFCPDTVLWATGRVVMLDKLPELELELEPEVELLLLLQQGLG